MVTGGVLILVIGLLTTFTSLANRIFAASRADADTQTSAMTAIQTISRDLRNARGLHAVPSSNPARLQIQLPTYTSTGALLLPIQEGKVVTYQISGTRLQRVVDNVATNVADLGTGGAATFISTGGRDLNKNGTIEQPGEVTSVTVTITTRQVTYTGSKAYDRSFTTSQEVVMRNWQIPSTIQ